MISYSFDSVRQVITLKNQNLMQTQEISGEAAIVCSQELKNISSITTTQAYLQRLWLMSSYDPSAQPQEYKTDLEIEIKVNKMTNSTPNSTPKKVIVAIILIPIILFCEGLWSLPHSLSDAMGFFFVSIFLFLCNQILLKTYKKKDFNNDKIE
jgi:hypothetical protein